METIFDPRAPEVLRRLNGAGYEAFLVGGCVRDALRQVPPHDYDVTTSALPEQVQAVFPDAAVIGTGLKHGTVTVLWRGLPVEVTTYRVDGGYSDGRHPDAVRFSSSLEEDLARRDLTVNAMAWNPDRGLQDPFGGRSDLEDGILRCVGDPRLRFTEDALRILRVLRFAAVIGFSVEENTARAARELRDRLQLVSAERIREELDKLLCGEFCFPVAFAYPDVLGAVLPELLPCVGFDQKNYHHCYDLYTHLLHAVAAVPPVPVLRWAALLHDIAKPACFSSDERGVGHFYGHAAASTEKAERILRRLRFDNASRERIVTLIRCHDAPLDDSPAAVRRKLNKLGEEGFFQLLALQRADTLSLAPAYRSRTQIADRAEEQARRILEEKQCFSLRDLAVNGRDLTALGYTGARVGAALSFLLDGVLEGSVSNRREDLLDYLKRQDG